MKDDLSNYSYTIQYEVAKNFPANGSVSHADSIWKQKHQSVIHDIAERFSMNINLYDFKKVVSYCRHFLNCINEIYSPSKLTRLCIGN